MRLPILNKTARIRGAVPEGNGVARPTGLTRPRPGGGIPGRLTPSALAVLTGLSLRFRRALAVASLSASITVGRAPLSAPHRSTTHGRPWAGYLVKHGLHHVPTQSWTVVTLVRAAGVPRAPIARRFTDAVGDQST